MSKKAWFNKILKTFGICLASIIGTVALTGGIMFLVGALSPKKVEMTNMSFSQKAYVLDGVTISDDGNVTISNYDSTVKLNPENEDATELDVSLIANGNSIARLVELDSKNVATQTDKGKAGQNLIFDLTNSLGGTFDLTANQDFLTASTHIFVDLKLNSFGLTSNQNENTIYPGTSFTVSITNCSPVNYLRKPSSNLTDFYSIYGQNYFSKNPIFFSSNKNIATVNQQTGEVTVLDEGEFTIIVYVPRTYKLNANLPSRTDYLDAESYFNALANYCVLQQRTFTSKSIEIGSITSSTEVHNVNVFTTYKYSYDDLYQSTDKQLNMNIKIHAPTGTSFSDDDLDYRAKDLEIYEGVYDSATSTYSVLPFTLDEETGARISEHFRILKTYQKHPYWEITPIDYYSGAQNYCLIAVIDDNKDEKVINGKSKVEITESEKFHFSAVKVVSNYTPSSLSVEKVEYLLNLESADTIPSEGIILTNENGEVFNLSDLEFLISPENASYKKIAFFIDASTPNGVLVNENSTELKPETDGDYKGKILVRAKNNGVAYINAVIVKTINSADGETYYSDNDNSEVVEMSSRVKIKLVITSKINFENFEVTGTNEIDKQDDEITGFKITKGKSVSLKFNSSNDLLTVYNQNLFKIYTSAEIDLDTEKVSLNVKSLGLNSEISLTGVQSGQTILYLVLNDEVVKQFNIQVVSDAIKSISLSENSINAELDCAKSDSITSLWNFGIDSTSESSESVDIKIVTDEDKAITNLNVICSVESDILEVALSSDYKTLTLTPKKQYDAVITLSVSTQNSDNETIFSTNILQFTISIPEIEFVQNGYNNTTTIAGKTYEKVVDGEKYSILKEKDDNDTKFIFDATTKDTQINVARLFKIPSNDNYTADKIFRCTNNNVALVELKVETNFGLEKTVNVIILPKYQLTTTTINLNNEEEVDLNQSNSISVSENTYNDAKNIVSSRVDNFSANFSEIAQTTENIGTMGSVNNGVYSKPQIVFEDCYDKVMVEVTINEVQLQGVLNIELLANVNLEASTLAGNLKANSSVSVKDLLQLNIASSDYTLNVLSVSSLPSNIEYSNGVLSIGEFKDLTTNILVTVEVLNNFNEVVHTYTNFNLALQISYYELFLNKDYLIDDTLYVFSENGFDLKNLILSATETSLSGVKDASDKVQFYDESGTQINSVITTSGKVSIKIVDGENVLLEKPLTVSQVSNVVNRLENVTIYESITYGVSNLVEISGGLYEYKNKILGTAKISCDEDLTTEPVINNLLKIVEFNGTQIEVTFTILGQQTKFIYPFEKLFTLNEEETETLYSHTQKELFTKKSGVNYIIQLEQNGVVLQNGNITLTDENNKTILKIGEIKSEIEFDVVVKTSANGYEGGTYKIHVVAKPLTITQNRTEIISGYEYYLNELISIPEELLDEVTISELIINGDIAKIDLSENTTITVEIKMGSKENALLLRSFNFNVICVEIVSETNLPNVYEGQILDRSTLLSLINLRSNGAYVNSYKSLVEINGMLENATVTILKDLNTIRYTLGTSELEIELTGSTIMFLDGDGFVNNGYTLLQDYKVYSGTKISNYVQAGYLVNTSFISLSSKLRFELKEGDKNDELINSLASDFNTTGTFTLNSEVAGTITIVVTLDGVENASKEITFTVETAKKQETETSLQLGVGDFELDISKTTYFGTDTDKLETLYELENVQVIGSTLSQYVIAKTNGKFVLFKDGVSCATIDGNVLKLTSSLDSMNITIVGYLSENIKGLTSTSTKEELVTLIIELTKIEVSMQGTKDYNVTKRMIGASEYNQIENVTDNAIALVNSADLSNSMLIAKNPSNASFNEFTNVEFKDASICDANGQVLYSKDDGSGFDFTSTLITLPFSILYSNTFVNQTITLSKTNGLQLSFNGTLVNYIHITLSYVVNEFQEGTINIILQPSKYLNYIGTTAENDFYDYTNSENEFEKINAPLIFVSNGQAIYSYYDLIETNDLADSLKNFSIAYRYYSEDNGVVMFTSSSQKYSCEYQSNATIHISTEKVSERATEYDKTGNKINYYLGIEFGNNKVYYYPLSIQEVDVKTMYENKENTEENSYEEITEENPLIIKDILSSSSNEIDLKQYIFVKTETSDYMNIDADEYVAKLLKNRLKFTEVSNSSTYGVSSDGILTINSSINEKIEINFSVCGASYSLFLQGELVDIKFVGNQNILASSEYYIYTTETSDDNGITILTTISEQSPTAECKDYLSFENYSYTYGANKITEQSLFDIITNGDTTTISYVGETLAVFTKLENYFKVSNLMGGFGFDIVTRYKETVSKTSLSVSSVIITTNYVSPSVVNGVEYQNILSNSTTDLTKFINCEHELTFTLTEYNNGVSISGSNLVISSSVTNELLLTIKVSSGEIYEYYHVRVIPKYKITLSNNNKIFNVIKGDTVSLADFMKVETFTKLDSDNNPIYTPNLTCYYVNNTQIMSPLNYQISDSMEIKVKIVENDAVVLEDNLTFNAKEITADSFGELSCYIGESLNVKEVVLQIINTNKITLTPTISFYNSNNDISGNGIFQSVIANKDTKVKITINNLTFEININVQDFALDPNYPANAYITTNNGYETKYLNAYATETLNLKDFINVLNKYENYLTFDVIGSSFSAYTLDAVTNKILYKVNGVKIFEIDNTNKKLIVYKELNNLTLTNNELLITLNCVVSTNSCKNCQLYLRLMKTELAFTKTNDIEPINSANPFIIKSENLLKASLNGEDSYLYNLNTNVAVAKTTSASNNIILTEKLNYVVIAGQGEIVNNSYLKLNKTEDKYLTSYEFQIQVSLGTDANSMSKLIYLTLNFDESKVKATIETTVDSSNNEVLDESSVTTLVDEASSEFKFVSNKFLKSDNTPILESGEITAIYSEDYLVTLSKPQGEVFNAFFISQNGKDIMWLSLTGTYKILVEEYHDLKFVVEARNNGLIIKNEISFVNSENSNNFAQKDIQVTEENIYEYENGIKYYVLYSGVKSNPSNEFRNYSISNEIVNYKDTTTGIIANVDELTYVQVEATRPNYLSYFVNFKIYLTSINKLYREDFTLSSDVEVEGDASAIQKGKDYKTLYGHEKINTFNFNDYFSIVSNNVTFDGLEFELIGATYLDYTGSTSDNKFVVDSEKEFCSLNDSGILEIKKTNTIWYLGIKVKSSKFNIAEKIYYFRILPLTLEDLTKNKIYRNYSSINLKELSSLIAKSEKSLTENSTLATNANDIVLTDNLVFKIKQGTYSSIKNGYLNISEIGSSTLILEVFFNNTLLDDGITLNISSPKGTYIKDNVYYEEFYDDGELSERTFAINNFSGYDIQKIIVNNVEYLERTTDDKTNVTTFTTLSGKVVIDANGNVTSTEKNIIYMYLKKDSEIRYIKLNNYKIQKIDGQYKFFENGQEKADLLRFEFVNAQGLVCEGSMVTDEYIKLNNLTLNRFTGALTGLDSSEDVYVKIYVNDEVYNTSERFVIVKLADF